MGILGATLVPPFHGQQLKKLDAGLQANFSSPIVFLRPDELGSDEAGK